MLLQEEPDQYHLKEGNVLKAESVLRQLAPPDEWCGHACAPRGSNISHTEPHASCLASSALV